MNIKYRLNSFVFIGVLIFISTINSNAFAQITGGEIEQTSTEDEKLDKKKNKESKVKTEKDSLTGSTYFLTGLIQNSYRTFQDESVFNKYEKLKDEESAISGGFSIGTYIPLNQNFSLGIGFSYFTNAEAYNYKDEATDSTFHYKNNYRQIGIPVKLQYTVGDKFQFFGALGITPLNIININYKSNYTIDSGIEYENDDEVIKEGFVSINFMATASIGLNYYFNERIGLTLYPEFRRHLLNTYGNDTFRRVHKMFATSINFGFNVRM
ncbi:outer membrane beta-barrel protein [Crocinitomix catalasitica]|uniref:outer membrane beta-barrel protein n=1 Tax=Crocinitomix catalasitica TaxID=184607 RepID=UPI000488D196|nr:outer membrane beta-barrel protein [Crocinitomix catalasitica]